MPTRYRFQEGMLAWVFHRISGVAIFVFVIFHIIDIFLAGADPGAYDTVLQIYASPVGRIGETLLGAALLYHALNGLRIIVMDFWPVFTRYHRLLWRLNWILFTIVGLPVAVVILKPIFGQ